MLKCRGAQKGAGTSLALHASPWDALVGTRRPHTVHSAPAVAVISCSPPHNHQHICNNYNKNNSNERELTSSPALASLHYAYGMVWHVQVTMHTVGPSQKNVLTKGTTKGTMHTHITVCPLQGWLIGVAVPQGGCAYQPILAWMHVSSAVAPLLFLQHAVVDATPCSRCCCHPRPRGHTKRYKPDVAGKLSY